MRDTDRIKEIGEALERIKKAVNEGTIYRKAPSASYHNQLVPVLTKRKHFAGLAMQGILSNNKLVYAFGAAAQKWVPAWSVAMADALITELNKEVAP